MRNLYDAVIVGGGPAGLTAAIYLARARYRVLVVEKDHFGGQITITEEVVNYPGLEKTSGKALTATMLKQAENFGAEFLLAEVIGIDSSSEIKKIETTKGSLEAFTVLIATGAHPRQIGFSGESEFRGRGVAYCATCDGEFFTGRKVFVVGGGFAAAEESVFLTRYAESVTILIREDDFTCASSTADAARSNSKITVLTNTQVESVWGDSFVKGIRYRNDKTGEVSEYHDEGGIGVFVFAGYEPETALIKDIAELNEWGYVKTDSCLMTSAYGIFAAGDVCIKPLRQVVTATGEGALAATEMEKVAAALQKKTGLRPEIKLKERQVSKKSSREGFFPSDIVAQLNTVFGRMEDTLTLEVHVDDGEKSDELKTFISELVNLSSGLLVMKEIREGEALPYVSVYRSNGMYAGFSFHGVPSGHEFTSFILGLYNASGSGQPVSEDIKNEILSYDKQIHATILVSLSCTMCPETVSAAERIATLNDKITIDVYDAALFPALREQYNAMSVPCIVINDKVNFGKKNVKEFLDLLKEA